MKRVLALVLCLLASNAIAGTGSEPDQEILKQALLTATPTQKQAINYTLEQIANNPIIIKKVINKPANDYLVPMQQYGMLVKQETIDDFIAQSATTIYSTPEKYVVVNIPAFMMYAVEDGNVTFTSKVIVGKGDKNSTKTPELQTNITHVGWNPYWAPPYNYSRTKTLAGWRKNKNYLQQNQLSIIRNSDHSFLASGEITEAVFTSKDYTIVQTPGEGNMLGKALFFLDNDEDVYMHDTNNHKLFDSKRRNFSLGCIRVQEWLRLATWVTGWDTEKVMGEINTKKLIIHNIKQIPVYVVYWPADVVDGKVVYYQDLYNWVNFR